MKIIKWWKDVPLGLAGFSFKLVPEQEAREGQACFDLIVAAVKKSDCSYVFYDQADTLIDQRP